MPRWLSGRESTGRCRSHRACGFDPWSPEDPLEEKGNPLEYPYWDNPTDRGTLAGYSPRGYQESDANE